MMRYLDIVHLRPIVCPYNILEPDNPVPPAEDNRDLLLRPAIDRRIGVQPEMAKLLLAGGQVLRSAVPLEPTQKHCPATIQFLRRHTFPPYAGLSASLAYKSIGWRWPNVVRPRRLRNDTSAHPQSGSPFSSFL